MENVQYRLEMQHISKRFGGIQALNDVSVQVAPGEIHALIGENGAGKSTLIKILSGAYYPRFWNHMHRREAGKHILSIR